MCVCVCVCVCVRVFVHTHIGDGSMLQVVDTQGEQGPFPTQVQAVGAARNVGCGSVVCGGEELRHKGRAYERYCGGDARRAM